ncbi:peptide chain release factor N(5)-glutamine methyltransferase [Candidatus Symbiobacter mobilis]|uniref:Release factor glutamine methyltransferase n=1 Tax=Candidatus Symbiobacter mobilis CR TaxID=946483 RepID=U5NDD6_9BURK|nr:peptide chain release factor N(5)-glutamine methyltransferase [Candidatus Symbiobacter mobilis]AGX88189.1 methyltransferase [Candidatus Symbiobacter mobilis CR]
MLPGTNTNTVTVAQALRHLALQGVDRLDAQRLLGSVLGCEDRGWLLAHGEAVVSAQSARQLQTLLTRYQAGEPMGYLLGAQEFHGLLLHVDARVLVPRPDTETLVDWALKVLPPAPEQPLRVLDLGTGSGAIALALQARRPQWQVCATDASEDALDVARSNAHRLGLTIDWFAGDWFAALPPGAAQQGFDAIVSNPPYIAEGDAHLSALHQEPALALRSGADGLDALRTIIGNAPTHLRPGGWLLLEHGYDQAMAVRNLLQAQGMAMVSTRRDLAGIERCSGGRVE